MPTPLFIGSVERHRLDTTMDACCATLGSQVSNTLDSRQHYLPGLAREEISEPIKQELVSCGASHFCQKVSIFLLDVLLCSASWMAECGLLDSFCTHFHPKPGIRVFRG